MISRQIKDGIFWMGGVDWDRRLFDSLIPLPDGTSYNAYLVHGKDKTVLFDTADPRKAKSLKHQLQEVDSIDYIVSHHSEQDHSGGIPMVLEMFPDAQVVTSTKGKELLSVHLQIPDEKFHVVKDNETMDIGGRTLQFMYTPWVHWPETMVTYMKEDAILFSCDFFGSHLATSDLYVQDEGIVYEAAKRYYAEIMMPFRNVIKKNLEKLRDLHIDIIAPSHGPLYDNSKFIIDAYHDWISDTPKNEVVIPYVSMHGSTARMVDYLVSSLTDKGIRVHQFELSVTDLGKLAISLVDAATIVIGTPTVRVGAHPLMHYAANLANMIKPKLRYAAIIGSYGWRSRAAEQIAELIPNLNVELLGTELSKGYPDEQVLSRLDDLANSIEQKHKELFDIN